MVGPIVFRLIAAVVAAGLARDWEHAAAMPADLAMLLLEQMHPDEAEPEKPVGPQETTMGNGITKVKFTDIHQAAAALSGVGWGGMRVGR